MRGDDENVWETLNTSWGSLPHMWGRSTLSATELIKYRFTPAYAGTITSIMLSSAMRKIHPRMRGDDPPFDLTLRDV